ncbi:MAG: FAD-dependent oxidoreductase, partial [Butyricicoccus sp.]
DTVCLAVGLNPMTELIWMAGCEFCFIPAFGGHVPLHDANMETTVPGLYVAGDVTGVEEASSAMEEGNMAGVAAAEALGLLSADEAAAKKAEIKSRLDTLRSGMFGERRRTAKEQQLHNMDAYRAKEAE